MPSIDRSFTEVLPAQIYLDTDFIIAGLSVEELLHRRARVLFNRAVDRRTKVYLSSLSWIEFINVVIKERFRVRLSEETHRRLQLQRWQDARVRRAYVQHMLARFDETRDQFAWEEVGVTPSIRRQAILHIADFGLRPSDAVHLASASAAGCTDLASFDEGFRRVDGLNLWNDRIHDIK